MNPLSSKESHDPIPFDPDAIKQVISDVMSAPHDGGLDADTVVRLMMQYPQQGDQILSILSQWWLDTAKDNPKIAHVLPSTEELQRRSIAERLAKAREDKAKTAASAPQEASSSADTRDKVTGVLGGVPPMGEELHF